MTQQTIKDVVTETAKSSPPIAVVTASITQGWTLSHTLTALTILYVLLQIAWLVWRWHRAALVPATPAAVATPAPASHAAPTASATGAAHAPAQPSSGTNAAAAQPRPALDLEED